MKTYKDLLAENAALAERASRVDRETALRPHLSKIREDLRPLAAENLLPKLAPDGSDAERAVDAFIASNPAAAADHKPARAQVPATPTQAGQTLAGAISAVLKEKLIQ